MYQALCQALCMNVGESHLYLTHQVCAITLSTVYTGNRRGECLLRACSMSGSVLSIFYED